MEKKRLNKTEQEKRKWKKIKLIGGISFLVCGTIFGIVALYLNGWDFVKFITNPTTDLVILCLLALGITLLGTMRIK